jgi:predicted ATPase/serine/threonine protein kinase
VTDDRRTRDQLPREGAILAGRYRVGPEMGRSAMGVVLAAQHLALDRPVALKFILQATASDGLVARFRREGRALALLESPHVVRVLDADELEGVGPYLVMERLEGEDLAKLAHRESPLEISRACEYARQAAIGLSVVHAAGIVHRDIKPANLFLSRRFDGAELVKVIDFGVVRAARLSSMDPALTHENVMVGSPRYMSPEQIREASEVDARSDVWSLAVTLHELLAGRPLFEGDSVWHLLARICDRDAPDLRERRPDAPEALCLALSRALRREASERTPDALAFATMLAPFCEEPRDGARRSTARPSIASQSTERASLPPFSAAQATVVKRPSVRPSRPAPEPAATPTMPSIPAPPAIPAIPAIPELPAAQVETRVDTSSFRALKMTLPAEPDAFVGRADDLSALSHLLEEGARLVTVLGPGGTGKTRLVTRFAWSSIPRWPGGVWFCDLSEARDRDQVAFTVAASLGVQLGRDEPFEQLGHAIAARGRCLVILDNFEQVREHAQATVRRWVTHAPEASFIATSRELLGVEGEHALPLDPLQADDAVSLFTIRATAARTSWSLDEEDRPLATELVRLLDGLPLAIELAAARVRVLPLRSILERMNERFKLLATSGRVGRQATLRGALDGSWELLPEDERSALGQLSVFEGGFSIEAAEAVLALASLWPLDAVQALVDKSLVRAADGGRFSMLLSVQQYAAERLDERGERADAERRHGAFYARHGEDRALQSLDEKGGGVRRRALAHELENLSIATERAVARGDGTIAARCALAAWAIIELRGPYALGVSRLTLALRDPGLDPGLRAALTRTLGWAHRVAGDVDGALARFEEAINLFRALGDGAGEALAHANRASVCWNRGLMDDSRAHLEQARALAQALAQPRIEAVVETNFGTHSFFVSRYDEALAHNERALALHRAVGNVRGEASVHVNLGGLHLVRGEFDAACKDNDAALAICRSLGDLRFEAICLTNLGEVERLRGRLVEAESRAEQSLTIYRRVGDVRGVGVALAELGALHATVGRRERAIDALTQAESILRGTNDLYQLCLLLATRAGLLADGEPSAARADLAEAERIAAGFGKAPSSELGIRIERARAALTSERE